jgi:RNA polymerase sigma-70 factor (ECF subfamily)
MRSQHAKPVLRVLSAESEGPSDLELIERHLAKDPAAAEALYRRHAPALLPLLSRLLASEADGLDALQDTFVIALSKLSSLHDKGSFRAWLRQTGVRCALRTLRRRRLLLRLGFGAADEAIELLQSRDAGPDVRAELRVLEGVLLKVPYDQRVAWMLRHIEGYELTEVAALCGSSLATIKRRIRAAQALIRTAVPIGEDEG